MYILRMVFSLPVSALVIIAILIVPFKKVISSDTINGAITCHAETAQAYEKLAEGVEYLKSIKGTKALFSRYLGNLLNGNSVVSQAAHNEISNINSGEHRSQYILRSLQSLNEYQTTDDGDFDRTAQNLRQNGAHARASIANLQRRNFSGDRITAINKIAISTFEQKLGSEGQQVLRSILTLNELENNEEYFLDNNSTDTEYDTYQNVVDYLKPLRRNLAPALETLRRCEAQANDVDFKDLDIICENLGGEAEISGNSCRYANAHCTSITLPGSYYAVSRAAVSCQGVPGSGANAGTLTCPSINACAREASAYSPAVAVTASLEDEATHRADLELGSSDGCIPEEQGSGSAQTR